MAMRFIIDLMLGKLSRWLRILGFDALSGVVEDREILNIAKDTSRTILSRDQKLIDQAKARGIPAIYIGQMDVQDQIIELYRSLGLDSIELDPKNSRCPVCNGTLAEKGTEELQDRIPPKVLEYHSRFWECTECQKVYWMGRHWEDIEKKINAIKTEFETEPD